MRITAPCARPRNSTRRSPRPLMLNGAGSKLAAPRYGFGTTYGSLLPAVPAGAVVSPAVVNEYASPGSNGNLSWMRSTSPAPGGRVGAVVRKTRQVKSLALGVTPTGGASTEM